MQQRAYAVGPGERLDAAWPLAEFSEGAYEFSIYGPNGFYRKFCGHTDGPCLEVTCDHMRPDSNRQVPHALSIRLANRSPSAKLEVQLVDNAYGAPLQVAMLSPNQEQVVAIDLASSSGWYDFCVRTIDREQPWFTFAGHVETGKVSVSDPAMA